MRGALGKTTTFGTRKGLDQPTATNMAQAGPGTLSLSQKCPSRPRQAQTGPGRPRQTKQAQATPTLNSETFMLRVGDAFVASKRALFTRT